MIIRNVPKEARESNRYFLALVLCFLLASTVIAYLFIFGGKIINILFETDIDGLSIIEKMFNNNIFSTLFSQGLILLCSIIFLIVKKKNIKEVLRIKKIKIGSIFLVILFGYAIMPLTTFCNLISMLFVENKIASTVTEMTDSMSVWVMLFLVAITPAIVEETAFRGIILSGQKEAGIKKAIILNGVMFGIFHLNFNQFAYALVLGMIFALVVEATDSIIPTMIIHFVINSSSVILTYSSKYIGSATSQETEQLSESLMSNSTVTVFLIIVYGIAAIIGTLIAVLILYAIVCIEGRKEAFINIFSRTHYNKKKVSSEDIIIEEKSEIQHKKIFTYSLFVSIILCVAYMIQQLFS